MDEIIVRITLMVLCIALVYFLARYISSLYIEFEYFFWQRKEKTDMALNLFLNHELIYLAIFEPKIWTFRQVLKRDLEKWYSKND